MSLSGQVAVLNGETGPLSRAIAAALARTGAKVVWIAAGAEVATLTAGLPSDGARGCSADTASPEGARAAADLAIGEFGGIHVLVNARGLLRRTAFERPQKEALADFTALTDAAFKSALLMSRMCAPRMAEAGGGAIVNLNSNEVMPANGTSINPPGLDVYAATRWALNGLTWSWALSLAPQNIRCNGVCVDRRLLHAQSEADADGAARLAGRSVGEVADLVVAVLGDPRTGENIATFTPGPLRLGEPKAAHNRISGVQ